ncbi:hypothetical protein HGRIS_005627 [Hohenbuehelia grisea]|uniref:Uncharacterized protein n=1 Tax=Hohenbuehelia grisea TaxID=104357 RepID=A0ABR3JYA9_9AGAR
MNSAFSLILLLAAISGSQARFNDLNPCFSGVCSFDLSRTNPGTRGSVTLSGASNAISDITEVTGWTVLDCHPTEVVQKIRIVCTSPGKGCDHLDLDGGAEGKIIRLPQTCSSTPFVRVVKTWVHEDQSVPRMFVNQLDRREVTPMVRGLEFDANFDAIDHTKRGKVYIDFEAEAKPTTISGKGFLPHPVTENELERRNVVDDVVDRVRRAADELINTASVGASIATFNLGGAVEKCYKLPENERPSICDVVDSAATTAEDISTNGLIHSEKPVKFKEHIPILGVKMKCGAVNADSKISVDVDGDLLFKVSSKRPLDVAKRTLVPRDEDLLSMTTIVTGEIGAVLNIDANIKAHWDTKEQPLMSVGLPGLDMGIFKIGPMVQMRARAVTDLKINGKAKFGVRYNLKKLQVTLPPKPDQSIFEVETIDQPLSLSAEGEIHAQGSIAVHVIPRLALGITMVQDQLRSDVFVDVDMQGKAVVTIDAEGKINNHRSKVPQISGGDNKQHKNTYNSYNSKYGTDGLGTSLGDEVVIPLNGDQDNSDQKNETDGLGTSLGDEVVIPRSVARSNRFASIHRRHLAPRDASASIKGCLDVSGGITVSIGSDGKIPSFNEWIGKEPLVKKDFKMNQVRDVAPL